MSWSREQCQVLIDEYQKHPCLFAVKSPQYKNKHARQSALETVVTALQVLKPDVTIQEIKIKWNGLRTNFLNEYKKCKRSQTSGTVDDTVYKPTLWYFDRLLFLVDLAEIRGSTDSLKEQITNSQLNSQSADYEQEISELQNDEIIVEEHVVLSNGLLTPTASTSRPSSSQSHNREYRGKKVKRSSEDTLLSEASTCLKTISRHLLSTPASENFSEVSVNGNQSLANFFVTKLNQITCEDVRPDVEMEISRVLYNGIKKSRNKE